jgi:hypothetical protein
MPATDSVKPPSQLFKMGRKALAMMEFTTCSGCIRTSSGMCTFIKNMAMSSEKLLQLCVKMS